MRLQAAQAIKAMWGHAILVDGHRLQVDEDGQLDVGPQIAQRLLAQHGWVPYAESAPKPCRTVVSMAFSKPQTQAQPAASRPHHGRRKKRK